MTMIELAPTEPFVFMKVGRHAGETLEEIIERKQKELDAAGRIFWGYGGGTMHPLQKVQPFVRSRVEHGEQIKLLMQTIDSRHPDSEAYATEFSADGVNWEKVPEGVRVRGSRYALVLGEIKPGDGELDLSAYRVGAGPSTGRSAADYIRGRVDKGCLDPGAPDPDHRHVVPVHFEAELIAPYAVLLRG